MRALAIIGVLTLAGCTQGEPPAPAAAVKQERPVAVMERVARRVQACWYKTPRRALKGTRLAAELDSYSGRPRILIVPRNRPTGLPKIVAEARTVGGSTRFEAYGPLLDRTLESDLNRWARGGSACTA